MPLIAHAGHWALWVVYGVPIAIVLVSIVVSVYRDRRERRAWSGPPPGADPR